VNTAISNVSPHSICASNIYAFYRSTTSLSASEETVTAPIFQYKCQITHGIKTLNNSNNCNIKEEISHTHTHTQTTHASWQHPTIVKFVYATHPKVLVSENRCKVRIRPVCDYSWLGWVRWHCCLGDSKGIWAVQNRCITYSQRFSSRRSSERNWGKPVRKWLCNAGGADGAYHTKFVDSIFSQWIKATILYLTSEYSLPQNFNSAHPKAQKQNLKKDKY